MPALDDARAVLRRHFGYPDFRGAQADAVSAVLDHKDVLVLMPTGGGKSLCYQVPSQLLPGITLVVSPLISLMKDQVDALEAAGIRATFVNSTLVPAEADARLARVESGDVRLLYVAPERFDSPRFRERLQRVRVSLLAVDEAHCISQWGHDFRPAYRRLGAVREALRCPVIALTATAPPEVRRDIARQLRLRDPVVLVRGFDRPNLAWHVVAATDELDRDRSLLALLRRVPPDGVAIVYASTRKRVDGVADLLNRAGVPAAAYHAGAGGSERQRLQDAFIEGRIGVVVATNAFGMGIDKPNVRLVVHHGAPASLEAYYQEAGRAGRDGGPATCVLVHHERDRRTHEFLIGQSLPSREVVQGVHAALLAAADANGAARLPADEIARRTPGARGAQQVEAALRLLADAGAIRAERPGTTGAWVVEEPVPAVDWRALDRRRRGEQLRLLQVEAYARTGSCRRAFVLRYFGERPPDRRCGGCDRCLGPAGRILPAVRPPHRAPIAVGARLWAARLRKDAPLSGDGADTYLVPPIGGK
ncbi:MAG TPA: ATP-dependent DNA helicase RecQ [Longimicrobiales bacterium]|nr:ATP-dependent DNA helicase RecQ [Longimicrobiales bacterium]